MCNRGYMISGVGEVIPLFFSSFWFNMWQDSGLNSPMTTASIYAL